MAAEVLRSCEWVHDSWPTPSCQVSPQGVTQLVAGLEDADIKHIVGPHAWDSELHFCDPDRPELVAQYLLVLDAINFCFWLDAELEYEHLAGGLKAAVLADAGVLDAQHLVTLTGEGLQEMVGWERPLPLQGERARLLREVGRVLLDSYGGQAANLVRAAMCSAAKLVELVTAQLPGFRDHAIYRGRQVFLYKRAQIFVADLWGALGGKGLGCFEDISCLTTFADYRVPVVLRELGVLHYSDDLASKVDSLQQLQPGSSEEVEIRAATVVAVEHIRQAIASRLAGGGDDYARQRACSPSSGRIQAPPASADAAALGPTAVQLDWWLWEQGERNRHRHRPHHRTLTIYY